VWHQACSDTSLGQGDKGAVAGERSEGGSPLSTQETGGKLPTLISSAVPFVAKREYTKVGMRSSYLLLNCLSVCALLVYSSPDA
jgi:hypothetical protein